MESTNRAVCLTSVVEILLPFCVLPNRSACLLRLELITANGLQSRCGVFAEADIAARQAAAFPSSGDQILENYARDEQCL